MKTTYTIAIMALMATNARALYFSDQFTPEGKLKSEIIVAQKHSFNLLRQKSANASTGNVYYTSTNRADFVKLANAVETPAVSNILAELNGIYKKRKWLERKLDFNADHYNDWRQVKKMKEELFDLGAIPILASNEWVNGAALADGNFNVPSAINWFEQNENPLHVVMYGTNAVESAYSSNVDGSLSKLYLSGCRVQFDRRFNLWRITEKFEFDDQGNLQNNKPQE